MRPDRYTAFDLTHKKLDRIAKTIGTGAQKNRNGRYTFIPGNLEVVRGGSREGQGVWICIDIAIDYTKLLSEDLHQWLLKSLEQVEQPQESNKSTALVVPNNFDDFNGQVRTTPDGRISVYDGITYVTAHKDPHSVWKRLSAEYPEVPAFCRNFQFPGQGQKEIPVATLQVFAEILVILPGKVAAKVREQAVSTLIRAMNGDPTLVDEIMSRMNPENLREVELSAKARREKAYGSNSAIGTLDNPILKRPEKEIRYGYGWKKRTEEMIDNLTLLAAHTGVLIADRKITHYFINFKFYFGLIRNLISRLC